MTINKQALLDALKLANAETEKANLLIDELRYERNLLQDLSGKRQIALEAAERRIVELEAREVVLPQRISMEGGAYCTAHARYDEDGDFYYRDEVIESLVAAGIITKVGE